MNLEEIFKEIIDNANKDTIKIANLVIDYCNDNKIQLTNLKLLKLLYFINIQYLKETNGTPIFNENFLAWRHGPVLLSVYDYFKYGITNPEKNEVEKIKSEIDQDTLNIIETVLNKLARKSAWELVNESHKKNSPWFIVYNANKDETGICQAPISHQMIYHYYKDK